MLVPADRRTLEHALADFDTSLQSPGRLIGSARVFGAYFLEENAELSPWESVQLSEAETLYGLLLEANGLSFVGARARLRRLYPSCRLLQGHLTGVRWSALKAELDESVLVHNAKETA